MDDALVTQVQDFLILGCLGGFIAKLGLAHPRQLQCMYGPSLCPQPTLCCLLGPSSPGGRGAGENLGFPSPLL